MDTTRLAQARIERNLTQAQVAEYTGVGVGTVCRWEKGSHQPYPRHSKKLCDLFGKSAQELGLAPSEAEEVPFEAEEAPGPSLTGVRELADSSQDDIELRLQHISYDWLYREKPAGASSAVLQSRLRQELEDDSMSEQHPKETDINRRIALRHLALLPIQVWSLDALNVTPKWAPEDILPHCAAGITACEQLSKGLVEDINLAYEVLTTYLPPLKEIVEHSSQHRKEAARLAGQALTIKAKLSVHRDSPKRAISYGKQAAIFSKESGNIPLRLVCLKILAWIYHCDKQERQALEAVGYAQSLLQKHQQKGLPIHHTLQSSIFGGLAKYQAWHGKDEEALAALHDARNAFSTSEQTEDDLAILPDFNYSTLLLEDGLTYYNLGQYENALSTFEQAVDLKTLALKTLASSERVRVEIINYATLASLKSPKKNMERSILLWKAGMQGAIDLRSEQRFSEALTAYDIMQALWPGDPRIKELWELTRHW